MTRPIKFRGKLGENGKYIYGYFYVDCVGTNCIIDENYFAHEVDPESIAQLVGYDTDGNEIYEGDVVIGEYGDRVVARLMDNLPPNPKLKEMKP